MADREKLDPATAEESDISKAQSAQQPPQRAKDQQRTDVEGASLGAENEDDPDAGIIGSGGTSDTSSDLIEDVEKPNFGKDQEDYVPEGK